MRAIDRSWMFVLPKDSKGWILDAICHEIGQRVRGPVRYEYNPPAKQPLPAADVYFFAHYWTFLDRVTRHPEVVNSKVLIWYTHPREIPYTREQELHAYGRATQLICTNGRFLADWLSAGLPKDRTSVVLGGADPHIFKGHKRGDGLVGLSSSYYPRKGAERIHELIRRMPGRRFRLLGRHWEDYPGFDALRSLPNFEYVQAEYKDYPGHYREFDVFLSMATMEGGPIPLLEAMMSNAVPVASRTGFAQDLICDRVNGYTFDVDQPVADVIALVDTAFDLKQDIRETVLPYSWENFAYNVISLAD
ncbi:MAG: glycosyltransferase [Rubrivivax sp.]|nr:glycosyltransferase [Rubrivivax sp.]